MAPDPSSKLVAELAPSSSPILLDARAPVAPNGDATQPQRITLEALLGSLARDIDIKRNRRVFVNRSLHMDEIDYVGFDMDYTLAIYNQPRIEALSVTCTLDKLVNQRGYPQEILNLDYDPSFAIRGIVVDRALGNIFKIDRYGHCGRVYHGRRKLDKEERRKNYLAQRIRLSSPRYAWIDTLFALPEAMMFARIVDYLDEKHARPRYAKLWKDIRESIDEAHRDESMKRVIKANLGEFLERDADLAATLHKLRSAGKRLFLLTNSYWDYTDKVMTWLLEGQLPTYTSWRSYFDIVVVGAQKPAFFTERRPFIELDAEGNARGPTNGPFLRGRVYQGGNIVDFDSALARGGDRVLYIGDHIYGDMLRAKKSTVWRTAMVIQELEREMQLAVSMSSQLQRIEEQERRRNRLEADLNYRQLVLKQLSRFDLAGANGNGSVSPTDERRIEEARIETRARLDRIRITLRELEAELESLENEVDRASNPWWGALFKEGVENSRFGEQVEDYACVYTSRVSNFLGYSPLHYFRSPRDHMPHEQ